MPINYKPHMVNKFNKHPYRHGNNIKLKRRKKKKHDLYVFFMPVIQLTIWRKQLQNQKLVRENSRIYIFRPWIILLHHFRCRYSGMGRANKTFAQLLYRIELLFIIQLHICILWCSKCPRRLNNFTQASKETRKVWR